MSNNLIYPIATAPTRRSTTNPQFRKLRASTDAMYNPQLKNLRREVVGQTCKTLKQVIRITGNPRCLKVSGRTLDEWMRSGRVPYFKIGKTVRFRWADVIAHLQKNRVN